MKKYRNALSRLRCSSHRLEIESGRWHRPVRNPTDERKCKHCNVVENEFHFLFECYLHNDLRIQNLYSYFYENPNQFKLKKKKAANFTRETDNKFVYTVLHFPQHSYN